MSEKFAERIEREVRAEADLVLGDYVLLRSRAVEVARVMRALSLDVPAALDMLAGAEAQPPEQHTTATVTEPIDFEAARRSTEDRQRRVEAPKPKAPKPKATKTQASHGTRPDQREARAEAGRVLGSLRDVGPANAQELAKRLGAPAARMASRLRELADEERIGVTGEIRGNAPVWSIDGQRLNLEGELADMPLSDELSLSTRVAVALQMKACVDAAREYERPFTVREVLPKVMARIPGAKDTPALYSRVALHFAALGKQGKFIKRTGKMRRAKGQTAGRTAVEYEVNILGEAARPFQSHRAAAESAAQGQPTSEAATAKAESEVRGADLLAAVRDYVTKQPQQTSFKTTDVATELGIPEAVAQTLLELLADRSIVVRDGVDWRYEPPTGPGAAARTQRTIAPDAPPQRHGNGGPVAGTGKQQRATHPEVRKLIDDVVRAGAPRPHLVANGHWEVQCPDGSKVQIANTPSSSRTVANDRVRLRHAGLKI